MLNRFRCSCSCTQSSNRRRVKGFFPTIILAALLVFSCQAVFAADYYVAPAGNDTDPGSRSLPWKTISKAADTMVAGDTVYIDSGTYRERIVPARSGSAGKYITYRALAGANVIIDGATITLPDFEAGLVHIENRSFIRISGLQIRNAGPNLNNAGFYMEFTDSIIIEGNRTYNTVSSGIGVWNSTNVTIDGNEVELACNDGEQECITVAGTNGFIIKNNEVHHNGPGTNGGEGIVAKDGSANGKILHNYVHDFTRLGIYVDAWDKHTYAIEVSKNRVHTTLNDGITLASEQGGLLENILVDNNVIYNNRNSGISVTPNGSVGNPPMRNLTIINNTLHQNGKTWGGGIFVDNPNIRNLVIRNNILSENTTFQLLVEVAVSGLTVDHNLIDGFRDYPGEIKGNPFVTGDPMFVDAADGDYHLSSLSPARDSGSSVSAPADDFDSNSRPRGRAFDIGAYEYAASGSPPGTSRFFPGTFILLKKNAQ